MGCSFRKDVELNDGPCAKRKVSGNFTDESVNIGTIERKEENGVFIVLESSKIASKVSVEIVNKSDIKNLHKGDKVKVWFVGPVLESSPAKACAGKIIKYH
ncbi:MULTISPECIES: DUF3221 domain-containing protein [Bacillus]|uniref:DUF3221 domain-containing protein n=1 Tax=Bacillus TaxID=1386 RepID=UPI000D039216|nr:MULTISPECIES: DUF3221 domain-containing protein [Bacillus]MBZ4223537.1 YobA family protein [Bacillus wiedmannii]MCI0768186.1 YobA family protein [Bacillus sp. TL12]MCP9280616.1 YobA family protein [Bacillus wiedmannii]PRT28077.1 hypothetical protein C6358_27475 [Bacillus wiedmannii]PRT39389.1 hypothetical protein C6359_27510 [Bacillus wiedmannii]